MAEPSQIAPRDDLANTINNLVQSFDDMVQSLKAAFTVDPQLLAQFIADIAVNYSSSSSQSLIYFKDIIPEITTATDIEKIFQLIKPYITFYQYDLLNILVDEFQLEEASEMMCNYDLKVENFLKSTTVSELVRLKESDWEKWWEELSSNGAQGLLVQVKIGQEWSSKTLRDLYNQFSKLFQCKLALVLAKAHGHSSIWLTLHAARPAISCITHTAFETIDELQNAGLLALKVGYLVIINNGEEQSNEFPIDTTTTPLQIQPIKDAIADILQRSTNQATLELIKKELLELEKAVDTDDDFAQWLGKQIAHTYHKFLRAAVKRGDINAIESFQLQYQSAECLLQVDEEGRSILHEAVDHGSDQIVKKVLRIAANCEEGKVVEEKLRWKSDAHNVCPLQLAIQKHNPKLADAVLTAEYYYVARRTRSTTDAIEIDTGSSPESGVSNVVKLPTIPPSYPDLMQDALRCLDTDPDSAIMLAKSALDHSVGNPVKLYSSFCELLDLKISPVSLQSTMPIIVVGDSGSGKSTLIKALQVEGTRSQVYHKFFNVKADSVKAGIIPTNFESSWFGKVIFYDLSSHREFVHESITHIRHLVDALFIVVINMVDEVKDIRRQLIYWLKFIQYYHSTCMTAKDGSKPRPNILVVGSHTDVIHVRAVRLAIGNSQRFRYQIYPYVLEHVNVDDFNIIKWYTMNCCRSTLTNWNLRWTISAELDRLRENRPQLSSKCYVIYAIILELIQASTDEAQPKGAIRFGKLMQELKKDKLCYRLFSGDLKEIKMLCNPLRELNLLLLLEDEDNYNNTWIVPDSYHFLVEIDRVIVESKDDPDGPAYRASKKDGVLMLSDIEEIFNQHIPTYVNTDLMMKLMIHYQYCKVVEVNFTEEMGYYFPQLLSESIQIEMEGPSEDQFQFAWVFKPNTPVEYFMPHHIYRFLLRVSQEVPKENCNLLRAKWSLSWADQDTGATIVIHVHSSQSLVLSMCSKPNKRLESLKERNRIIGRIKRILEDMKSESQFEDTATLEAFIPANQRHFHFPVLNPGKFKKQCQVEAIKDVIKNRREGGVSCHTKPSALSDISDLLYFEPYYYMEDELREALMDPSNANTVITQEHFTNYGLKLERSKVFFFFELLGLDPTAMEHLQKSHPSHLLIEILNETFELVNAMGVTYSNVRDTLDSISFFKLKRLMGCSPPLSSDPPQDVGVVCSQYDDEKSIIV